MRSILFTLISCLFALLTYAQSDVTLNGYVKNADDGETLIGATVYITSLQVGATTNEYGFFALKLPPGSYELETSYLGFESQSQMVILDENKSVTIELKQTAAELEEVVVQAETAKENVENVQMSVNKLSMETIKKMPSLLGEVEVIRSLQLLPGVTSVGEGATGFNVRGGSIDQNLVLLDEAPVYNSSHLFGFFSVFNPDAVKDVKLYKGGIPPRYGGRLSSILDVRMKEGNNKKWEVNGGVGVIFSRLSVEGPIAKDKASFIIAGRRSYIDVLAKPFLEDGLEETVLNFYDLTVKANYIASDRDRIFVSGYFGRDNFGFGNAAGFNWGNSTASMRWNHLFNERLFSNITAYFSDYDYKIQFGDDDPNNQFDWNARIKNFSVKPELSYYVNPNNAFRFGGQSIYYVFEPGNATGISEGEVSDFGLDEKYALESALYIENERNLGERFKLIYGLRWSHFAYLGEGRSYIFDIPANGERRFPSEVQTHDNGEVIETYNNFEPRLALQMTLNNDNSLKLSYNRTAQYIHLISNTTASTPVDVWSPSTNNIKPQMADQVALGYFQNFNNDMFEFSAETYYKTMDNIVDYIDGADLILNEFLEGDLLPGEGRAYGLELMMKKNTGKYTGWLSYTLGRTERRIEGVNQNDWYPSRFDQTHNLSITGFRDISKRFSVSAVFSYISGTPTTFQTSRFEQQGYVVPHNAQDARNNVRIPDYHRLDLSATLKGKRNDERRWKSEWVFSIYNVYNRRNPFSIYLRQDFDRVNAGEPTNTGAYQLSVVGNFIPAISYNFKW